MVLNLSNFMNNNELLPIVTSTLLCDLVIAFSFIGFYLKKTLIIGIKNIDYLLLLLTVLVLY